MGQETKDLLKGGVYLENKKVMHAIEELFRLNKHPAR